MIDGRNNRDTGAQVYPRDKERSFVERAFSWFEHKVLNFSREHKDLIVRRRVVLLAIITFIGSTILFLFSFLAFYQNAPLLGFFDIVFAISFILNLIDARIRKNYHFNILVGIIIASCLYIFLYLNGGVNRTAFVWCFTFPLMASFLLGSKKGAYAMLMMAIPIIGMLIFDFPSPFFAPYTSDFEIRFLGAYLLVGVFSYMFEKAGEKSRDEIIETNKNLEAIVEYRTSQLTNLNEKLLKEIEEHKHAEVLLTQSEQRYKSLIDLAAVGILLGSHDGYVLEANKCMCEIMGLGQDDLVGRHISELAFTQESLNRQPFRFDLLKVGETVCRERDILQPDGTKVTVEMLTVMMPDKTYQAIFSDITKRNETEQELRASEERFRLAFQTSPDSININSINDGTYVDINDGFTKILGYTRDDIIGKSSVSLNVWKNIEDRTRLVRELKKHGYAENVEAEFLCKNGETKIGLMSASVIHIDGENFILSITRDMTDRKREEAENARVEVLLQQAQRLKSVGTLAGGIAHDFNNLLMGIQGRTALMTIEAEQSDASLAHIRAIDEHVRSASNLTKQLLGAARGGKYDPKPTNLNDVIEKSSTMFGRARKEITIHTHYSDHAIVAVVDRTQIEQVLLNLYVNAWQAMPDGGELHLESHIMLLEKEYCQRHQVEPGYYAKISVADTGVGMDKNIQQQIFDPFFTTKKKGRGTGLGLASAFGIIANHNGFITVHSEVAKGTTFTFYLPLSKENPQQESLPESAILRGSETILLVDDEKIIIDVGSAMLDALGYEVLIAQGGREAIHLIKENDQKIDLVILDLIMPEMDGERTFDRIREICPFMPIILSSGYAIEGQAAKIMAKGCNGFMQKPFNLSKLSQITRSVIEKQESD